MAGAAQRNGHQPWTAEDPGDIIVAERNEKDWIDMSENRKPLVAFLSIIVVACLGALAVLWTYFETAKADAQSELRAARLRTHEMTAKFKDSERRLVESAKPNVQPVGVVSEGEYKSLIEKLRLKDEELSQSKAKIDRLDQRYEMNQKGMMAAAKLQGDLKKELEEVRRAKEKSEATRLELIEEIKKLKAKIVKLQEQLKTKSVLSSEKVSPRTARFFSKTATDENESEFRIVSAILTKPVQRESSMPSISTQEDTSLVDWIIEMFASDPKNIARLADFAGDNDLVGHAISKILGQANHASSALRFMSMAKYWTLDRVVARARKGIPWSDENIDLLGQLIHGKAKAEGRTIEDEAFCQGILGAAHFRFLASRPIHEVSFERFIPLIEGEDAALFREAQKAISDPRRRHEWIAAVLKKRSEGGRYPKNLEALVWDRLEDSIAAAVVLADADPSIANALRRRIPLWAKKQGDDVVRRVACETLLLVAREPKSNQEAWIETWTRVWPSLRASGRDLLSWLDRTQEDRDTMAAILMSPSFGCVPESKGLCATRQRQADLARAAMATPVDAPSAWRVWSLLIRENQPLLIPFLEDSLNRVQASIALEIATRLFKLGRPSGEAWFRQTMANNFDRRMPTIERLFEIGSPLAHEIARTIIGHGDYRTTYRLVELGWEQNVNMPRQDIARLLRSPYLDPVRMDVIMAYFERCLGDELPGMVTEALFDPSAERPETLLDYLAGIPDQKLLPLIARYLVSDRHRVRESALRALAPLDLASEVSNLMAMINDSDMMVRVQLARCLGTLGQDEVARGGLLVLCKDKHPFVREAAFDAMAFHNPDKLLPALRSAVGDRVPDVAVAAAKAQIMTSGGDDAAFDLLFKKVEDPWLGESIAAFLKKVLNKEFKTRDAWRAWFATRTKK